MGTRETKSDGPATASLMEISRVLEETARIVRRHAEAQARASPLEPAAGPPLEITASLVRAILRVRQLRADFLPEAGGDPAWTMILELYAAELEGSRVNQLRLITAAAVPHTTGLRIVHGLLESGTLVSRPNPAHGRRRTLHLSEEAKEKVRTYLTVALATVPYLA